MKQSELIEKYSNSDRNTQELLKCIITLNEEVNDLKKIISYILKEDYPDQFIKLADKLITD